MPEPHVVFALKEKRSRVAGELKAAKRLAIDLRLKLVHLDACLRMFDEGYTPKSLRPKTTFKKNPAALAKGAGSRGALDILRETGEAFDAQELARRVLVSKGKEATPRAVAMLAKTIHSTFSRSNAVKHLVRYDTGTWPGKWEIVQ